MSIVKLCALFHVCPADESIKKHDHNSLRLHKLKHIHTRFALRRYYTYIGT